MCSRSIEPSEKPLDAVIRLPGAKSLCNRALILAGLASGRSVLSNFLFCDDTARMLEGLAALGISFAVDRPAGRVEVTGCAGQLPESEADIDCGESGTMLRFVTAMCATATGVYRLHGRGRLHDRPMGPLVHALRQMGAGFQFEEREDFAPFILYGKGLRGGQVEVDGSMSSQFTSALLLSSPCAGSDVLLTVTGQPVSRLYTTMTCEAMQSFGIDIVSQEDLRFIIPAPQIYDSSNTVIEPDASTAGCLLAAAAICGGRVRIEGLGNGCCQPDMGIVEILGRMGCEISKQPQSVEVRRDRASPLHGIEADLRDFPDSAPTLAVLALFAGDEVRIRGVAHLQHKESKRLTVLAEQLARLGAAVDVHEDGLTIHPPTQIEAGELDPHGDHRLAMAFSLLGLAMPGIAIRDPDCVNKSYPEFFTTLCDLSN